MSLIGQAKSGSGKTAAFVLGLLAQVDTGAKKVQGLIVCPTRELATQVFEEVKSLGKFMIEESKLEVLLAVKDTKISGKVNAHVIVGTPGTLHVYVCKRKFIATNSVKALVLDEADQVLDDMKDSILRIKESCPKSSLTFLFSATFSEKVKDFALKSFINKPYKHLLLKTEDLTVEEIAQYKIDCTGQGQNRIDVLHLIYSVINVTKSIIFVRTKKDCDRIYQDFSKEWRNLFMIHGDLEPSERDRNMVQFRDAKNGILITTNLLARGIDILGVTLVINYDLPTERNGNADHTTYLHRVGRTGRFGFSGIAINLLHDSDDLRVMKDIEQKLGEKAVIRSLKNDESLPQRLEEEQKRIEQENKKHQQELQKK